MSGPSIRLRRWRGDAPEALLELLRRAVAETARSCYDGDQIDAWLSTLPDPARWRKRLADAEVIVAYTDSQLAGFVALRAPGLVDLLFVDPGRARQGIGRALVARALVRARACGWRRLACDASLLARPLFEAAGFRVLRQQRVTRGQCRLTNFRMAFELSPIRS